MYHGKNQATRIFVLLYQTLIKLPSLIWNTKCIIDFLYQVHMISHRVRIKISICKRVLSVNRCRKGPHFMFHDSYVVRNVTGISQRHGKNGWT
jgi:hypothetical protein